LTVGEQVFFSGVGFGVRQRASLMTSFGRFLSGSFAVLNQLSLIIETRL